MLCHIKAVVRELSVVFLWQVLSAGGVGVGLSVFVKQTGGELQKDKLLRAVINRFSHHIDGVFCLL